MNQQLSKAYIPQEFEDRVYKHWEKSGFFNPDSLSGKTPFTISMPPPNATGTLHLGHSVMLVLQDLMIRYHRMKGDRALWLPGTDHASIATQNKVEKIITQEGKSRHDLGREKFLERVTQYVEESRATIRMQIRKMGSSCDWSRERYTLDAGLSYAVSEMFIRMYGDGLIYRDWRIVNWCPRCMSTLADDEVKHVEREGTLYTILYGMRDSIETIPIATTRPETMLGDSAIAVHPKDPRYERFIGKVALLPLGERELPIIADGYVDMSFGTGALKVTPAHDANDFLLGKKHHLKVYRIMDDNGTITLEPLKKEGIGLDAISRYEGLDRAAARKVIVSDLTASGKLVSQEKHMHVVGTCYRCDTVIEPIVSLQWFISVDTEVPGRKKTLKDLCYESVKSGAVTIVPKRFEKIYFHWIENLRDWCISRQIWFGHRLPVYYCRSGGGTCRQIIVSHAAPDTCPSCAGTTIAQDEDTLDTWFSSGLWTFSTLGWPDQIVEKRGKHVKTNDLAMFHPTSVLETGYDILPFWVARMILMSQYALSEVPFSTVYLHGLVLDVEGKKMSKSKEATQIDPLDMIAQYGTDALRLSLVAGVTPGNDTRLSTEKIESHRNFINKLWNISRFILEYEKEPHKHAPSESLSDQWIEWRLKQIAKEVTGHLETFRFSQAVEILREYTWNDLADWYLEIAKIEGGKKERLHNLLFTLLALWHPFIPFVTETIYQHAKLRAKKEHAHVPFLMIAPWPHKKEKKVKKEKLSDPSHDFELVCSVVTLIRNARAEHTIPPSQYIQAVCIASYASNIIASQEHVIKALCRIDIFTIVPSSERVHNAIYLENAGVEIYLPLGLLKMEEERARLTQHIDDAQKRVAALDVRLSNTEFSSRAPRHVIESEQKKRADILLSLEKLQDQLKKLT